MLHRSDDAPVSWRIDQSESEIRKRILKASPDFVFFQELPNLVPFVEGYDLLPSNVRSHCGVIATLVRSKLMPHVKPGRFKPFAVTLAIESDDITFANVHLEPGRNGSGMRREMLATLANHCDTDKLVIVGDTNTRLDEESEYKDLGLIGDKPPTATWDTRANRFRDGAAFTAYFTRYFHSTNVRVDNVKVWDQPMEFEGKSFFLSDHFALSGRVRDTENSATDQ